LPWIFDTAVCLMPAFRIGQTLACCARLKFLYYFKASLRAAASGGRPRPAPSA